jgi:hypothetical protein
MKKAHLEFLLEKIVRHIMNELSTMDMKKIVDSNPEMDNSTPPEDAMSSIEKNRLRRDQDMKRKKELKQKEVELDAKKKELDFHKKQIDQEKRFDIPNLNKDLQSLKMKKI